ncbi:phosphoglycerate mutase [Camelimonas fluminis]|uniref:SixA phosphatase family protein n=1 Tax=Camelimonas fluminis TaxID=1576911 RepID=A0ABV7ULU4_9HYPH|nr:histidine phosphatase family protein [Camelimonas fluminis]GHE56698.1 phosphoglycerate mutase [Camelimonas fluminis]
MLRLMLLRHAKAAWPRDVRDPDRPLADRGRKAAPLMGAYMTQENLLPDLAIVSTATRTRQTWDLVGEEIARAFPGETIPVVYEPRIYEARVEDLLHVIQDDHVVQDGRPAHSLLLVGHNPGFEELAHMLVGHGDRYAFARLSQKYPTGGLAVIDFNIGSWAEVTPRSGRLDRFVTPRTLEGMAEDHED